MCTCYIFYALLSVIPFFFSFPVILAESIPQLGLFISLVGAISSTALALMFPPLAELIVMSQKIGGIPMWIVIKDFLIIFLGLFIFVTGTYESMAAIVRAFQS